MPTVARLERTALSAVPGQSDQVEITVTNTGHVVDQFLLQPLGEAAAWFAADPPALSLFPGASGTARLTVTPPRSHLTLARDIPFAVRVLSQEDPAGSAVEEGQLRVGRFDDAGAELLPRTAKARGRRGAKYQIAIDNRGNARLNVAFTPVEADQKLDFDLAPSLVVEPGEAAFLPVKVRGRKSFLRGQAVTLPFQVVATGGPAPLPVDGSLLQEAVIPRWVPKAAAAVIVIAALLVGGWFALLKPVVKDTATDAANMAAGGAAQQAAMANKAAQKAAAAAAAAGKGAPAAPAASPAPAPGKVHTPTAAKTAGTLDPLGNPVFYRLAATGGQQAPTVVFPAKQAFSLTDIVLQNNNGDAGTVTLMRGNDVLLALGLENFRNLDFHYVAPFEFGPGQVMTMKVDCKTPGSGTSCSPAVSVNGFTRTVTASPTPAPGT